MNDGKVSAETPAVLLVNLGTPDAPTAKAVRPYLREFLSDRRVIETHPALWKPILEGIILRVRPAKSAEKYAQVWGDRGSPLLTFTEDQADYVARALGESAEVRFAMRYGKHGIQTELQKLYEDGYREVLIVPLYPQYSQTTTGTVMDEVYRWGLSSRDQFALRSVRSFETDPSYIEALASAIEKSWETNGKPDFAAGDRLILSFHGIPMAMVEGGDPYPRECEATARAVRERLQLPPHAAITTYQSVFGPAEWTKPATIDTVTQLGHGGGRVDVVCPGFVSDCLETLEEINMENRDAFLNAGGATFNYVPWGNAAEPWLEALTALVKRNLEGWL